MTDRTAEVREIKYALNDPRALCEALGLLGPKSNWQKQAAGVVIRCPVHDDRTASCSVQLRKGLVLWNCHGCNASGDALSLVAAVRQLSVKRDFKQVMIESARIAGLHGVASDIERGVRSEMPIAAPIRHADAFLDDERTWPEVSEVDAFWGRLGLVSEDSEASGMLARRGLDAETIDVRELARVIGPGEACPKWAVCRGGNWAETGYRLVVPMFDASGTMRSVRGWRVIDGDGPKRRPPFGHKASGLVMADGFALAMLRGQRNPERLIVCEGEPDYLTWATRVADARTATVGIVTGSWTDEFTQALPKGLLVIIRTHRDPAGEKYAKEIALSIRSRCFVRRAA